ncbi:hypothetical protein H5410_046322 [Solanum commersonii]|uniref:Uncharacterized protein n=1 Tax=Solanum commersonii TaxID=4109 RepID=A0A9J5XG59_SOLCO|nr:hypothetical protein H5410_046322 [Solanum commersonii]
MDFGVSPWAEFIVWAIVIARCLGETCCSTKVDAVWACRKVSIGAEMFRIAKGRKNAFGG